MFRKQLGLIALISIATLGSAQGAPQEKHLKLRIAVAPLDYGTFQSIDQWQIPVEFRNAIDEKLAAKLHDTGRFVVLEREAMAPLLQEQAIKEENTGKSEKGKIIPAQALIRAKLTDFSLARRGSGIGVNLGSIGRVGGDVAQATVGVNLTMFDVDTSALIATADAGGKASSSSFKIQSGARFGFADFHTFENSPLGDAMNKALDQTVLKILDKIGSQPWSAHVADFDTASKEITLNAGEDTGVQVGDTFDLMHVSGVVKDPDTGEVIRVKTSKIGRVKIKQVDKKFSVADLIEGSGAEVGDLVQDAKA
jgi:curli biogenesis system outer membrane secretion channel CsgG